MFLISLHDAIFCTSGNVPWVAQSSPTGSRCASASLCMNRDEKMGQLRLTASHVSLTVVL
jgi:hypothetical protein